MGVVEGDGVGVGGGGVGGVGGGGGGGGPPTEDMTRLYLLVSPQSCEGRQLSLLTVPARPPGNSDPNIASIRDKRPTGEFS